jgi:hypothetical protein
MTADDTDLTEKLPDSELEEKAAIPLVYEPVFKSDGTQRVGPLFWEPEYGISYFVETDSDIWDGDLSEDDFDFRDGKWCASCTNGTAMVRARFLCTSASLSFTARRSSYSKRANSITDRLYADGLQKCADILVGKSVPRLLSRSDIEELLTAKYVLSCRFPDARLDWVYNHHHDKPLRIDVTDEGKLASVSWTTLDEPAEAVCADEVSVSIYGTTPPFRSFASHLAEADEKDAVGSLETSGPVRQSDADISASIHELAEEVFQLYLLVSDAQTAEAPLDRSQIKAVTNAAQTHLREITTTID